MERREGGEEGGRREGGRRGGRREEGGRRRGDKKGRNKEGRNKGSIYTSFLSFNLSIYLSTYVTHIVQSTEP